tara:strand:- start:295 stop:420 length:126 start_codon:yes stop_codon:yes gene_type:complete
MEREADGGRIVDLQSTGQGTESRCIDIQEEIGNYSEFDMAS